MSKFNFLAINDYNDVAKGILFAIYEIFWKIVHAMGSLIDVITGLFYKLAGMDYLGSGGEALVEEQDLLTRLINQNIISNTFLFMCLASLMFMAVFGAIAVIKQNYFSKDEAKSTAGVIKNMMFGMIFMIALAPLAMFAISFVSTITDAIVGLFGDTTSVSLADLVFEISFTGNPIEAYNTINSTEITSWTQMENGFLFELDYGTVETGVTFNWYVYLLGAGLILYNLVVIVLRLVKRIFSVIVMYLVAPVYVAKMVEDGGAKLREWKNKTLGDLVSIVGTVIAFMVLLSLVGVISELEIIPITSSSESIDTTVDVSTTVLLINNLAKMVLLVAGVSVAKDAGELFGGIFKGNSEESTALEGILSRLGPKEYSTVESKQATPRTRIITKTTTTNRRIMSYTEDIPVKQNNNDRPINVTNNNKNNFNATVNNIDRKVSNIQNRTNVSVAGTSGVNDLGNRVANTRPMGDSVSSPTDILKQDFSSGYRKEMDKIHSEWDFMKNSNSGESKQVVREFESASKDFNSSISSGDQSKIKNSMNKYVEAYRKEEKVAKEGYKEFAGKSTKLSNDLSSKQQDELRKISTAYRKAQVDYSKTARKLGEVSKGNMSAADALRVKEKADKQREKLMAASSKANDFYNSQKKGV